jgi:hypothetical protein
MCAEQEQLPHVRYFIEKSCAMQGKKSEMQEKSSIFARSFRAEEAPDHRPATRE